MKRYISKSLLVFSLALPLSACSFFGDSAPSDSCTTDDDCFVAQGEICGSARVCIAGTRVDAGASFDAGVDAATSTAR